MNKWIRKAVSGNSAAVGVCVALTAAHIRWHVVARADRRVEAVAGFGATLVALGIWLAVRPLFCKGIRRGIEEMTGQAMPPITTAFLARRGSSEKREAQRPQKRSDVIAEQVGLALILAGTLLNGYSGPIARFITSILPI